MTNNSESVASSELQKAPMTAEEESADEKHKKVLDELGDGGTPEGDGAWKGKEKDASYDEGVFYVSNVFNLLYLRDLMKVFNIFLLFKNYQYCNIQYK